MHVLVETSIYAACYSHRSSLNYLNVVAFTELMMHAKSKLSSELERGVIYLWNDVRDIDINIDKHIKNF